MPQNHTRNGLDFKVLQALFLPFSEIPDLLLGEFDIFDIGLRDFGHSRFDLVRRKAKFLRLVSIKFLGKPADRLIAMLLYVCQDFFNDSANLRVRFSNISVTFASLQKCYHL